MAEHSPKTKLVLDAEGTFLQALADNFLGAMQEYTQLVAASKPYRRIKSFCEDTLFQRFVEEVPNPASKRLAARVTVQTSVALALCLFDEAVGQDETADAFRQHIRTPLLQPRIHNLGDKKLREDCAMAYVLHEELKDIRDEIRETSMRQEGIYCGELAVNSLGFTVCRLDENWSEVVTPTGLEIPDFFIPSDWTK